MFCHIKSSEKVLLKIPSKYITFYIIPGGAKMRKFIEEPLNTILIERSVPLIIISREIGLIGLVI